MKTITRQMRSFNRGLLRCAMRSLRPALGVLCALCLSFSASVVSAAGENFPHKAITIVVPFAAGGSLDVTARLLAPKMSDYLGQPVVILNKPGGGSSVGARVVAAANPDGYTIFLASGSAYGYMHLLLRGYDLQLKDFAPIAGIATNTSVFAVNDKLPVKTLPELLDYAKKNPGKINFCTTGVNGLNHLQLEQLRGIIKQGGPWKGVELTHVPYNGLAPAVVALKENVVQACTLPFSSIVKKLDGNGIRIIAVMRPKRLSIIPKVPTTGEEGFPQLDGNEAMVNFAAPAGTPQPVLAKLENAIRIALQDPKTHEKLVALDVQPGFVNSAATKEWLEQDVSKFSSIIHKAGLALSK
ncbi:MAG TPA: tripartite tricarboxylate transporter substrate binding protein [Burkholderiales bacterium]|nr:tripartite tricarboxylate transporter substrate binding protein [Burkholderiales bacterium]